jgi:hypothetical protein
MLVVVFVGRTGVVVTGFPTCCPKARGAMLKTMVSAINKRIAFIRDFLTSDVSITRG